MPVTWCKEESGSINTHPPRRCGPARVARGPRNRGRREPGAATATAASFLGERGERGPLFMLAATTWPDRFRSGIPSACDPGLFTFFVKVIGADLEPLRIRAVWIFRASFQGKRSL
ncbi:hypothetical protein CDAR_64141 [Caerostris darwini]|uniref:Uncharacterized protein n=1 Tax=Caerostris darwini TaxID=1538125 RepID=A0AAV4TFA5_9ARAC|nr:hypothetical protein CDAR_64141 [Caerostris darwini]